MSVEETGSRPGKGKSKKPTREPEARSGTRKRPFRVIDGGKSKGDVSEMESRLVETFALTDTGNAERLASRYGDRIRYCATWGEHLVYTGTHWRRDTGDVQTGVFAKEAVARISEEMEMEDSAGRKTLARWQKESYSRNKRKAMIDLVKHESGIAIDHDGLDLDHWTLNVANGTLDLRTGELRQHNPDDAITKHVPIKYNPKAKAPRWTKFLREVIPDTPVREFVHRFMGYCLTGDVSERMFVIFLGGGKNGKSAFLNAIEAVMGQYATTAAPTLLVAKQQEAHPTEVADLFKVRLAVISETKKGGTFDEERVKRLTGTDRLKARRMREDFWHFDPTHKLLLAMNHKPRVRDATDSFWDRVAIVPFNVRIAKDKVDRQLGDKLKAESEGILLWLLEGLRLWREGGLKPPPAVREATQEYREEEDIVGRFLTECCVADKSAWTYSSELMAVNKAWCDAENLYQMSAKELAAKLSNDPWNAKPGKREGLAGYKGIRLTVRRKFK